MPLPALRDDLQLLPGPTTPDGEATWTVLDPVSNRHFRIGWRAFQLLSRWDAGTVEELLRRVRAETVCNADRTDVDALLKFLWAGSLTVKPPSGSSADYQLMARARRSSWYMWLVHHYLFFRIPLVHPDRFLRATLPLVEPAFSPVARYLVLVVGLAGLYLAGRQWGTFLGTLPWLFSLEGLAYLALALVCVKVLHELGHAYTATRYGCRVPTMGVAFLVLWPVLYTDATGSWKLTSRRQRIRIGAAGIITELALAMVATFLWAVLPDSPARSTAFFVAAVSWVTSLLVNANPCMRFDGYYVLSDWLGVDNLQERSFALGRWATRRALFGSSEPPPERFSPSRARVLIVYSWCVWIYRFFLFIAIGLLVYHLFFKLLGIVLFAVEIAWFIALPIARELSRWWQMRGSIAQTGHARVSLLILIAVVAVLVVPWHSRVTVPAVLERAQHAAIHAPRPGRIAAVHLRPGDSVHAGEVLLELHSPQLDYRMQIADKRIDLRDIQTRRSAAGTSDLTQLRTLRRSLQAEQEARRGLEQERERLVIRAPFDGVVTDVADGLHPGRWINESLALALLVAASAVEARGLVMESDVALVEPGAGARFYPEDGALPTVDLQVGRLERANLTHLDRPYLASEHTGEVPVRRDSDGRLVPERAVYRVHLAPIDEATAPTYLPIRTIRGTVNLSAEARSIAQRVYDRVVAVLIRETGF
ncbi:MAG: HlyD family efflux transporter periplasmic adaptor subunit [Gammaproteobacteria bacterium]